ncbi:MAG: triose-phosphate isomerase [Bacteroidia bacterium]|nr:MAG: triose-phosphate isomerase [Bacteroidia bacterium]
MDTCDMAKRRILAGNWKCNPLPSRGVELATSIVRTLEHIPTNVELLIFPPYTHLHMVDFPVRISLGAQNCARHGLGPYTADIAAAMLHDMGVTHVLIGHSERRLYHGETGDVLVMKIREARQSDLKIIYCCGEPEEVRAQGEEAARDYVIQQIEEVLLRLQEDDKHYIAIAYEPVWAIGTGKTASPEDAEYMCKAISEWIVEKLGITTEEMPVLYGGSCNPSNAKALFAQPHISGGLIGTASLNAADFLALAQSFPSE